MDLENPVVKLCAQGMQAESEGRGDDARALFSEAWDAATDDYEACVAAHYLARHQNTPEDTLRWNQECLERADRVGDERVRGFYPSLHLNIARAHEELGSPEKARTHFQHAAECLDDAPAGPYREGIRFAVAAGLRTSGLLRSKALPELLDRLCARADLTALGLLLPPYLGDLGTPQDRIVLLTALQMVHANRSLPEEEQTVLRRAIDDLT
ncbi:hypothetical protein [Actinophytocola oryzae]|uniref:Tetratricopeptide repeat protein n=1 Tax=Actinophytocola oryzae TaxID=502181 RepID=A0A4V3FSB7_9PSEU|nr:hypothetical protein [Actinophytocola oryzae]TDV46861.1 hypothetical protein CLV71_11041 [Actinophytocola oryzae]